MDIPLKRNVLQCLQLGIRQHQPFDADRPEIDLHALMRAFAFHLQDHALAKFLMADALPQFVFAFHDRCRCLGLDGRHGTADRGAHSDFLNEFGRNLAQKTRRPRVRFAAV